MKLGVISKTNYRVSDADRVWDIHSFEISPDSLSFYELFHSALATPARYVEEIFVRLGMREGSAGAEAKLVFNPLFDCGRLVVMQTLAALRNAPAFDGITVIVDRDGLPVGYIFPPELQAAEAGFLSLLSTVDGQLDAALCRSLFAMETRVFGLEALALGRGQNNSFLYKENAPIYKMLAEQALDLLAQRPEVDKNTIPFVAFMPHHAGDVLFFVLAANRVEGRFSQVAVNRVYADIVRDNAASLEVLPLDAPPINRDAAFGKGEVTPESSYFYAVQHTLPRDRFLYYCRPSRDYNVTRFHLIDHFAFAMGRRFCSSASLLSRQPSKAGVDSPDRPAAAPRVLLHFDGGWALKVYPREAQQRLIDLLADRGCQLTVLAEKDAGLTRCEITNFKNYAHFKGLIDRQDVVVGMDSFPAHYSTHIRGLPTICLFASTRPENANAPANPGYVALERGLACRPCYGIVRCPVYGLTHCQNFVAPERVAEEVEGLLNRMATEAAPDRPVRSAGRPGDERCEPPPDGRPGKTKTISMRHIRTKVVVATALHPYVSYVSLLYSEFSATVRTDGYLRALLRSLRFLRRSLATSKVRA